MIWEQIGVHPAIPLGLPLAEEKKRKLLNSNVTQFPAKSSIDSRLTLGFGRGNGRIGSERNRREVSWLSSMLSDRGTRRAEVGSCYRGSWLGSPRLFPISGDSQQPRLAVLRALGPSTDGELVSLHDVQAYP
jgi:hypothetical protein